MNDSMHRVIILDKLSSPYIKQAIIVLNEYDTSVQSHVLREAEAVVSAYMNSHQVSVFPSACDIGKKRKSRPKNGWLIFFSLFIILVAAAAVIIIR